MDESLRWVIVPAAKELRLSFITTALFPVLELKYENMSDLSASQESGGGKCRLSFTMVLMAPKGAIIEM